MAGISKITIGTENGDRVLVDLTGDSVNADSLVVGHTAHGADGEIVEGANPYELEPTNAEVGTQSDLIAQIQNALVGKAAGSGGGKPEQDKIVAEDITTNGPHTFYPDDGYTMSKVTVNVNVPDTPAVVEELNVTENGEYTPGDGVDGFSKVTVNVPSSGGGSEPDFRDLYQRVEYITTAEEETYPYIITDFYGDNDSGMEVVAAFPVLQDRVPMGSREDSGTTRFYCVYPLSANSIYYGFNTGSTVSCPLKVNTIYRCQTNFLNSRLANVYDEDGDRKGGASLSGTLTTQSVPVSIFGYHSASSGTVTSKREFKLYSARCSRKHEVVREYIPCYRKSDGVVGVLEKFTGQFLTPEASAFTSGPEIDW